MCRITGSEAKHCAGHQEAGKTKAKESMNVVSRLNCFCVILQSVCATNGAVYYAATPPTPMSNMQLDQFAAVYPPGTFSLCF